MEETIQAASAESPSVDPKIESPPAVESNPQQVMLEQLAAELVATRQQLAAVQHQLGMEQAAAQSRLVEDQAIAQQRYGQMIQSVEQFVEGKATVADVVKTVSTNIAQDDSLWKGALVGAAAAVLLTSGPVKDAMGKSFGNLFPGLQSKASGDAAAATDATAATTEAAGKTENIKTGEV